MSRTVELQKAFDEFLQLYGNHPQWEPIAKYIGQLENKPAMNRIKLIEALEPLVKIAERYTTNNLDEARPDWGDDTRPALDIVLFTGRGGAPLLTLEDCIRARQAVADNVVELNNTHETSHGPFVFDVSILPSESAKVYARELVKAEYGPEEPINPGTWQEELVNRWAVILQRFANAQATGKLVETLESWRPIAVGGEGSTDMQFILGMEKAKEILIKRAKAAQTPPSESAVE